MICTLSGTITSLTSKKSFKSYTLFLVIGICHKLPHGEMVYQLSVATSVDLPCSVLCCSLKSFTNNYAVEKSSETLKS
jgi:hypothetical protein